MRQNGRLSEWNADRGFGFIKPDDGGDDLYVQAADGLHGPTPLPGELLSYEVVETADGQRRVVDVIRLTRGGDGLSLAPRNDAAAHPPPLLRQTTRAPARPARRSGASWSLGRLVTTGALVLGLAAVAFHYRDTFRQWRTGTLAEAVPDKAAWRESWTPAARPKLQCDGRQFCSQMTSCTEARFFQNNCADAQMPLNQHGLPCEALCTSVTAP